MPICSLSKRSLLPSLTVYTFFHNLHKVRHLLVFHKHPFEETVRDRTSDNLLTNQNCFHYLHNLHSRKAYNVFRNCQSTLNRKIKNKTHAFLDKFLINRLHVSGINTMHFHDVDGFQIWWCLKFRYFLRFFIWVGHETTYLHLGA